MLVRLQLASRPCLSEGYMAINEDPVKLLYERMAEAGIQKARDHRRPVQRFRASEAGDCLRRVYYRLSGCRPAPLTPRSMFYMDGGNVDHDLTRRILQHYDIPVGGVTFNEDGTVDEGDIIVAEYDVMLPSEDVVHLTVSCRPDGFIAIPGDDDAVLEIKGIGFWQFSWLQKTYCKGGPEAVLERIREKHKSHLWQTMVTMELTRRDNAYLLYKDRASEQLGLYNDETEERAGVCVPFDSEIWAEILQRWAFVRQCIDSSENEPPAPEYSDGSGYCNNCDFHYMCHGAEERRQQGKTPVIKYPGPQIDIHLEDRTPTPEVDGEV